MEVINESLPFIVPEIVLALTFVLAMIVEFTFKKNKFLTPVIVLAGFVISLITIANGYSEPRVLFYGMFVLDPFSIFFKYLIIGTSIVITLFSLQSGELKKEKTHSGEYYCFIAALTFGLVLMTGANNLLMMYLAIELSSISSYILAGFTKSQTRSGEAALKYVIFGGVSSGIMLYGISLLYGLTGTLDIQGIRLALATGTAVTSSWGFLTLITSIILMLAGFGYKISAVPFHFWTPDVYEGAPVTVTAYLAVASKAAGFAMMIRFFTVSFFDSFTGPGIWQAFAGVDWPLMVAILALLTMTLGNVVAIWQNNLKRMLAYSSIAHAGYMLLGVVVMSNAGISAVMLYFVMYFFMNLGAFYVVMVVADKIGSEDIDAYRGLGYRAPVIGVALTVFLVSLTGLPPTAGFIGKLYLFAAVIESDYLWLVIAAAINTVFSLYYYARVFRNMYLRDPLDGDMSPITFKPIVVVVAVLFIIPTIVFGLFFEPLVEFAQTSVTMFLH
jgi:NADH-quinone oxidoreductase subunit N